jgi:hypothetical protein
VTGGTGTLEHDATCPLGQDLDAVSADDWRWFEDHPRASLRRRPPAWCERDMIAACGVALPAGHTWHGEVVVRQIGPGVRVRSYGDLYVMLPQAVAR